MCVKGNRSGNLKRVMAAGVLSGMMALMYLYVQSDVIYAEAQSEEVNQTDAFGLILYDEEKQEVFSEVYPEKTWIEEISEGILEIGISVGSPARYTVYFGKEDGKISRTFFNAKVFGGRYIAHRPCSGDQWDGSLILTDIFEEGILYQEIHRDFSVTADPMSAIYSIELIDKDHIILEYCEGEEYAVVSEVVEIQSKQNEGNLAHSKP